MCPKQVIKTRVWGQIISREPGEIIHGLPIKKRRTEWPIKPKMETDSEVGARLVTAEIFTLKNSSMCLP